MELLEDPLFVADGQASTFILDANDDRSACIFGDDRDERAGRRVLRSVLQQVDEQLLDQHAIDMQQRQLRIETRLHTMIRQLSFATLDSGSDEFLGRIPLSIQLDAAAVQSSHFEKVAD